MEKAICGACDWVGDYKQLLRAQSPFDPVDTITGCPSCNSVNSTVVGCDIDGCKQQSTCGFTVKEGYMRTCGKHYREFDQ